MIHSAVLPAGVEGLQDDEDRVLVLGVEDGLLARQLLAVILSLLLGLGFRCVFALVGRIELVQPQLVARTNKKLFAIVHAFLLLSAGRPPSHSRQRLALTRVGQSRPSPNQVYHREHSRGPAAV